MTDPELETPHDAAARLDAYREVDGLAEWSEWAALDRALSDPAWVGARLERLRAGGAGRTRDWARDAIVRLVPDIRWSACHERADARHLQVRVDSLLRPFGLWTR